jgi:hypothetical protein
MGKLRDDKKLGLSNQRKFGFASMAARPDAGAQANMQPDEERWVESMSVNATK